MRVQLFLIVGCLLGALAVSGCSKHGTPPSPADSAPSSLKGDFLGGADQTAIRAYLQSVHELKPKKFEVQWSADTVAVSRDEAMRSLHAVNEDGSDYTFASSEPVVRKLQPGRILWIWDIALRRIEKVGIIGDETIVHTTPVALTDAITQADIEFAAPLNFSEAYGGYKPHSKPISEPPKTSQRSLSSPLRLVAYNPDEPGQASPEHPAPGGDSNPPANPDEIEDLIAPTKDGYTGKIAGFLYSLGYHSTPTQLTLELQAKKVEEGGAEGPSHEMHRDQQDEFFELVKEQNELRHEAYEQKLKLEQLGNDLQKVTYSLGGGPIPADSKLSQADRAELEAQQKSDEAAQKEVMEKYKKTMEEEEGVKAKAKALASAGALAAKVFFLVSDNVDIRFRAKMELDKASLASAITIASGQVSGANINFNDLNGSIEIEFVGRLGQPGSGAVSIPVADVPIVFNIPLPIGGIPFVAQLGSDFLVKLFLSGKHAAHHWLARYQFSGGGGLVATASQTDANGNLSGSEPQVEAKVAESPGTSGTVLAIQLPKVGLGLGLFGAGAMAFVDMVNVITITNSAGVATLNPQCKRFTQQRTCHVGVELSLLPTIPFVGALVSHALSWTHGLHIPYKKNGAKKDVCNPPVREWVEPDIKMCHI